MNAVDVVSLIVRAEAAEAENRWLRDLLRGCPCNNSDHEVCPLCDATEKDPCGYDDELKQAILRRPQ